MRRVKSPEALKAWREDRIKRQAMLALLQLQIDFNNELMQRKLEELRDGMRRLMSPEEAKEAGFLQ